MLDFGDVTFSLLIDPLETAFVIAMPSLVPGILIDGCNAEVGSSVIQAVMIDVVYELAGFCVHHYSVHVYRLALICAVCIEGAGSDEEVPAVFGQLFKVFVVYFGFEVGEFLG